MLARRIEEQQIPYVLIDRQFPGLAANFIGVDDIAVGRMATEHLHDQGCAHVAHIRGPEVSAALARCGLSALAIALVESKTPQRPRSLMVEPSLVVRASSQRRA